MPKNHASTQDRPRKNLIRLSEAVEQYPISRNTIRRRIAEGELTAYRFGPKIITVDVDELDALFKPTRTASPSTWGNGDHVA